MSEIEKQIARTLAKMLREYAGMLEGMTVLPAEQYQEARRTALSSGEIIIEEVEGMREVFENEWLTLAQSKPDF